MKTAHSWNHKFRPQQVQSQFCLRQHTNLSPIQFFVVVTFFFFNAVLLDDKTKGFLSALLKICLLLGNLTIAYPCPE